MMLLENIQICKITYNHLKKRHKFASTFFNRQFPLKQYRPSYLVVVVEINVTSSQLGCYFGEVTVYF